MMEGGIYIGMRRGRCGAVEVENHKGRIEGYGRREQMNPRRNSLVGYRHEGRKSHEDWECWKKGAGGSL